MNNGSCHIQGMASNEVQATPLDAHTELADAHLRTFVAHLVLMEVHSVPYFYSFVDPSVARLGSTAVLLVRFVDQLVDLLVPRPGSTEVLWAELGDFLVDLVVVHLAAYLVSVLFGHSNDSV